MTTSMVTALGVMASLGCLIGICLAIASRVFYVYVDPLVEAVDDALPGANCGGCGYAGCTPNAEAIVAGESSPSSCVAGGEDLAETIAGLLGLSIEAKEPDIAASGCIYSLAEADQQFAYGGIADCRAAALLYGGMKVCDIGCLGLGTCVRACPFGALQMGENGLPVVDAEKCTGCGTCERVCPKHIITLSSVTRRILKEYTVDDCTTPCQRACPAGINIREYIRQITLGDYTAALAVIKERIPFPAVIGRICPRFCEFECRRNLVDEPVAINALKRFLADQEKENGRALPFTAPATGRQVAVIGGGVEGLSAAYFCARLGHAPLVLEATAKPGGLLRKAIARERLPLSILDDDLAGIQELGIRIATDNIAGRDFSIDSLLADSYETVYLATGGWDSRLAIEKEAPLPASPVPGLYLLIDLLKKTDDFTCGQNVILYGGAELADQAVAACQKAGAANITLLLPGAAETVQAEGVHVIGNAAVETIYGLGGQLTDLAYTDRTTGQRHALQAQTIVFSAGRLPELVFSRQPAEDEAASEESAYSVSPVAWQAILPWPSPLQTDPEQTALFVAEDARSDINAAVKAMAAGRRGAAAMHMVMYGDPLALPETVLTPNSVIQTVGRLTDVSQLPRNIMPLNLQPDIGKNEERETGFDERVARDESARCLQCGLICYERR